MKIKIYDYLDKETTVTLKRKPITAILVVVCSGDEIVTIYYEDGFCERYDSNPLSRWSDFFDCAYLVRPERIKEWAKCKSVDERTEKFSH